MFPSFIIERAYNAFLDLQCVIDGDQSDLRKKEVLPVRGTSPEHEAIKVDFARDVLPGMPLVSK
uniref:Uncharacterized protein n=1 Tax=Nelumbo nucifera TaxID=4432 RepID=A0A822YYZ5_NELNU|nr:TPA_asm: hypothetical protein HUJ06_008381 [Nelumbo nucifera]